MTQPRRSLRVCLVAVLAALQLVLGPAVWAISQEAAPVAGCCGSEAAVSCCCGDESAMAPQGAALDGSGCACQVRPEPALPPASGPSREAAASAAEVAAPTPALAARSLVPPVAAAVAADLVPVIRPPGYLVLQVFRL